MFPEAPEPINYIRTNWGRDQFARGTFTYIAAGSSPDDCKNIAQNIGGKVWFAGEYAYPNCIGTVNSAAIAG